MTTLFLISILALGGLGAVLAAGLAVASKKLRVQKDPKIEQLQEALPGANCGACRFPGCAQFAAAVAEERAPTTGCTVGGPSVAEVLAHILGIEAQAFERKIAVVHCGAKAPDRTKRAAYWGPTNCRAAEAVTGGELACRYGCLGYGDCVIVCEFDAIAIVDGLPVVDPASCTGCNRCVVACPRNILSLEPWDERLGIIAVACNSLDRGPVVRRICKVGCIACRLCVRTCSNHAFYMDGFLAKVDQLKARESTNWDEIIEKCPTSSIVKIGLEAGAREAEAA